MHLHSGAHNIWQQKQNGVLHTRTGCVFFVYIVCVCVSFCLTDLHTYFEHTTKSAYSCDILINAFLERKKCVLDFGTLFLSTN